MKKITIFLMIFAKFGVYFIFSQDIKDSPYPWLSSYNIKESIYYRILPPSGFKRTEEEPSSFGFWLRFLPLKPGNPPVYLFDGRKKANQDAHFAIIDIDTGKKDLQQCADAVIRLRAEYLWYKGLYNEIHFNFLSGFTFYYERWMEGFRPEVLGNKVFEEKKEGFYNSYKSFRKYLDNLFKYANTYSLSKEMVKVEIKDMKIGDVFICERGAGRFCHAVMVVDMVINNKGEKKFLLAQSFMPAQDIHILRNFQGSDPWYGTSFGEELKTPEWTFSKDELKRFK